MIGPRQVLTGMALSIFLATPSAGAFAAPPAAATIFETEPPSPVLAPPMGSAFALPSPLVDDGGLLADRGMGRPKEKAKKPEQEKPEQKPGDGEEPSRRRRTGHAPRVLSGDRARLMLQSLTVPGWGQASLGQRRPALAFGLLEAGVWGAFTAFRIQHQMRRETYERTARLFGGIDLSGRDDEFQRIVGFYLSSDEYNRLVVRRDAANLYFGDPAAYDAYIAQHELKGADTWAWGSESDLERYRTERQSAQRATKHAQDALAAAVINRLLSAIHASRSGAPGVVGSRSYRLQCVPVAGDPTAFRFGLRADF